MRERDINRNFTEEGEIQRIRTILFPKKHTNTPAPTLTSNTHSQSHNHNHAVSVIEKEEKDGGERVRAQIDKLRGEITTMLGRRGEQSRVTERAYLDGISRLTKQLKSSASEVREVFDEFLDHLPTKLASEPRSYALHYHYSLLIQNFAWHQLAKILRIPLQTAFQTIKDHATASRERQERMEQMEKRREERAAMKKHIDIGKAFRAWRLNGQCLSIGQQSTQYLREHSVEGDQRLLQSLLNLPLLVLMLEELGREAADISELLVLDETGERACKFMQQGLSALNSSLETVTQRSLLQSARSNDIKFSRFQLNLLPSLTHQCVKRGEILFVSNLSKSPDYSQADNLCYWQSLGKSNPQTLKGGAIFYPIFDNNHRCLAVLRQYFYQGVLNALPTAKLRKICAFLEVGINMQNRMRIIMREREYHRQGYYMKMIGLVRKMEIAQGNEKDCMMLLQEQLKKTLGITSLTLYRVDSSPHSAGRQVLLRKIWGESEDCTALVSLAHQLLKQHSNYIYLDNRLVVYCNQTLFDLKIPPSHYSSSRTQSLYKGQSLPIDLIVSVLAKVQTLLTIREVQSREIAKQEQMKKENEAREQAVRVKAEVESVSIQFILSVSSEQHYTTQISSYIAAIHKLLNQPNDFIPSFCLECQLGKSKKDKYFIKVEAKSQERIQDFIAGSFLRVPINEVITLHCHIGLNQAGKEFQNTISTSIQLFMKRYLKTKLNQSHILPSKRQQKEDFHPQCIPLHYNHHQKKKWELIKMNNLYESFKKDAQWFTQSVFGKFEEVIWLKEKPNADNLADWKNSLYRLMQAPKDCITIEISNKNPLLSNEDFCCLKSLTLHKLQPIQQESSLLITSTRSIYRSKNAIYQNSFVLKLPFYCQFPHENPSEEQTVIVEALMKLKESFLEKCQAFISGVNLFNQNLTLCAVKSIVAFVQKTYDSNKKYAWIRMRQRNDFVVKLGRSLDSFAVILNGFSKRLIFYSLNRLCNTAQRKAQRVRLSITRQKPISHLCLLITKLYYQNIFQKLKRNNVCKASRNQSINLIEDFLMTHHQKWLQKGFNNIHSKANKRSKRALFFQILGKLMNHHYFVGFNKMKRVQAIKQVNTHIFDEFEQCKSLLQIRQKLENIAPNYTLTLHLTPDHCFPLYTPQNTESGSLLNIYQTGPEGQFTWHYPQIEGEDSFQIKDRLNTLSKCLQIAIRNCKKAMSIGMLQCSTFHNSWVKRLKAKFFRVWVQESGRLQMIERNRLNDSLYQMGIESKTIKEKLKAQEKVLKNNVIQNQELLKKQQQYKLGIAAHCQQIATIEQNQAKLQHSKTIYNSLHRRSLIKGIFLLWRTNASFFSVLAAERRLKAPSCIIKTAVTSIVRVLDRKKRDYLAALCWGMAQARRQSSFRPKDIDKIEVKLEERGGDRLVTFQSELEEQQNSYQYSNRSQLEHSSFQHTKRHFDSSRSPLQKVQLSVDDYARNNNGAYKLNPKTLKFLKRMGKLQG